jgi:hypothetical protein
MTARLEGTNFKVLPLTVLTQFVCVGVTAEWRWEVTALKEGAQHLTLVLTAVIDDEPPFVVKTFEETIEIQVGLVKKVFGPIAENLSITLSAFLAALGAAVGTWSWKRFRGAGAKGESAD